VAKKTKLDVPSQACKVILATPFALHVVEVLELLKASPMSNIHQAFMLVLFPIFEFIVPR